MTDTPSSPDIVADLDHWLRSGSFWSDHPAYQLMERARDEIVALRDNRNIWLLARAEALEEAAQIAEMHRPVLHGTTVAAAAIRALKEKP